jgi:glycine/D-amino acid oxidase-like deaminating enzyme
MAGVAAALQAAREGRRTALLEKTILLGGLATAGLVWFYPPLYDGHGRKVTAGLPEELLHLCYRYGPYRTAATVIGQDWTMFSPASFIMALDEALLEAGVDLWLDTLVCAPLMEGDRVRGVEAETKGGRIAFQSSVVVDATGDADIAHRAGAACVEAGNLLTMWVAQASMARARRAIEREDGTLLTEMVMLGSELTDKEAWATAKHWSNLTPEGVTAFVRAGYKLLREHYAAAQAASSTRHQFPVTLPTIPQFRTTRRIVGRTTITAGEYDQSRPDSIGLIADCRVPERVWEIPYGSLVPEKIGGLLVAGRCMATEEDPWEATRIITGVGVAGQAAGLAAALAAAAGLTPGEVPIAALQERLRKCSVPCHYSELGD